MKSLKQKLYAHCHQWVDEKIALAQNVIRNAQSSANQETKSSAGDKYETGRAMAQLEIEKSTTQLAEANKLKQLLNELSSETLSPKARLGSLIETDNGWFYLSISAGKVAIDGIDCICLSPASPLGNQMMGLQAGDQITFNQLNYFIKNIH